MPQTKSSGCTATIVFPLTDRDLLSVTGLQQGFRYYSHIRIYELHESMREVLMLFKTIVGDPF